MKNIVKIFILLALYSCHYANKNGAGNDSTIVIITQDAPEHKPYYSFPSTGMRRANFGEIEYVDTSLNITYYQLKASKYDTITIHTNHDDFEVKHEYNAFDNVCYLLNRGDTILLTYTDKNIPYARILNRQYNENELNFDYLFTKKTYQPDSFSRLGFFRIYRIIPTKFLSINGDTLKQQLQRELMDKLSYLDSLRKNNLISNQHYDYRKNNIYSVLFLNKLDSVPANSLFMSDSLFLKYDSLIYLDYYRNLLNNRMQSFFKPPYDPNNPPNWGKIEFDSIIYSPNYSNTIKRFVFQSLADDLRNATLNYDLQKMLVDYKNITGDSITYNKFKEQFGLLKPDSLEVSLKNAAGNVTSLSQVIEKHRGKYIFVDFWATWCMPCRALLPDNAKMEKEYKGKNIAFVTLAFNDDEKRWKNFISENSNLFDSENYIITNTKSSRLIEEWKIRAIPRYMLFGKNGEIELLDAPRPNTKEIRDVFNKLLK